MSHKHAPNENWGRELLELFSMGQGNYSEDDVKDGLPRLHRLDHQGQASHRCPSYGRYPLGIRVQVPRTTTTVRRSSLAESGNFNGEDIIDIILERHPATARFIARHLYNFFVADEVQVPSWKDQAPQGTPRRFRRIADTFSVTSNYDMQGHHPNSSSTPISSRMKAS